MKNLFSPRHLVDSFCAAFQHREFGMRHVVIILVALFALFSIIYSSGSTIDYSYAKKKFEWSSSAETAEWWSTYGSFGSALNIIAIGLLAPGLSKFLHFSDMLIVTMACTLWYVGVIVILLAEVKEVLYLAKFLTMFSDVTTIGIRSALTKIVGSGDVGKIFACVALVQAGSGLISPLYNIIYLNTLEWHVGFIYCINEILLIIMITASCYCTIRLSRYNERLAKSELEKINVSSVAGSLQEKLDIPS